MSSSVQQKHGNSETDPVARVKAAVKALSLQRTQLELALETAPRDSRYSAQLVDLMRREETVLGDLSIPLHHPQTKELTSKVDRALHEETSRYFGRCASSNMKKWEQLRRNLDRGIRIDLREPRKQNSLDVTLEDLELEAARLEEEYNRNWLTHEGFHLREAFNSQAQRVERDWGVHEKGLREDYAARRRAITGSSSSDDVIFAGVTDSNDSHDDSRWQHPEKQKTLIHTAPVLSPTAGATKKESIVVSAMRAVRGSRSKEDAQLEKLDKQFTSSMEAHNRQKDSALRWMYRQKIRLMAQAEAVQAERAAIADIIHLERVHYQAALDATVSRR